MEFFENQEDFKKNFNCLDFRHLVYIIVTHVTKENIIHVKGGLLISIQTWNSLCHSTGCGVGWGGYLSCILDNT